MLKTSLTKDHIRGILGELYLIIYFFLLGYRLLKWRYKPKFGGEIDIIFRKGKQIVFCEVKTRIGMRLDMNHVEGLVSQNQIRRITASGIMFIEKNPRYQSMQYRFDLAIVVSFLKLPLHIKNIGW